MRRASGQILPWMAPLFLVLVGLLLWLGLGVDGLLRGEILARRAAHLALQEVFYAERGAGDLKGTDALPSLLPALRTAWEEELASLGLELEGDPRVTLAPAGATCPWGAPAGGFPAPGLCLEGKVRVPTPVGTYPVRIRTWVRLTEAR